MTTSLSRRVQSLERIDKWSINKTVKELTNEELSDVIRDLLEEYFEDGKYKDTEETLLKLEAQGKTFYEISMEPSEWFDEVLARIIKDGSMKEQGAAE